MRVGINALYLLPGQVGGTETYLRSVLRAWAAEPQDLTFTVFLNRESENAGLMPSTPVMRAVVTGVRATHRSSRLWWEQTGLPAACRRERIEVLFNPGFTAPLATSPPAVTVFHDLQYRRHPEFFKPLDLVAWRVLLAGSARRSSRVVCISESTKADFERFYPSVRTPLDVVLSGVDDEFRTLPRSPDSERPYLLTVSTLHPHKNLERLLMALTLARQRHPGIRLVLAGLKGFATGPVVATVQRLGLEEAVEITGWIPRADLLRLFADARAFIYPSLFEGFGLPVLEALAAGLPTVCSDIPALREVAGSAALRVDPYSVEGLAGAIERVWREPALREHLSALGPLQASSFSWASTARGLTESLRRASR